MKKFFSLLIFALFILPSCKRCFYCKNECKVCDDANFTITVCSDRLSKQYYHEYIDSLTSPSLGWECRDTMHDKENRQCFGKSRAEEEIVLQIEKGFNCTEID